MFMDRIIPLKIYYVQLDIIMLLFQYFVLGLKWVLTITFNRRKEKTWNNEVDTRYTMTLPVGDVINEMLFEHEAPSLDDIEQGLFKWLGINSKPCVKQVNPFKS